MDKTIFRVFDGGEPRGFGPDKVVELWVETTRVQP